MKLAITLSLACISSSVSASVLALNLIKVFTGEKKFCWDATETVFAFGDSYTNLMGPAGSVWTWNNFASADSALNGPIQVNGTTAHGPNWIQYLTNCYQGLPQNCRPKLWDLAYGGATVDRSLVAPTYDHIKDFGQQVDSWHKYIDTVVPSWDPDTTLTMLWFGINDVQRAASEINNNLRLGILFNKILDVYFQHLDSLHKENHMRFFLINNMPPMDRAPVGRNDAPRLRKLIESFNDLLLARVAKYSMENREVTLVHFDAHKYFDYYLNHYQEFGFKDIEGSCDQKMCQYPQYEYFWMNNAHPMYPVHKLLGVDITAQLRKRQQCTAAK